MEFQMNNAYMKSIANIARIDAFLKAGCLIATKIALISVMKKKA